MGRGAAACCTAPELPLLLLSQHADKVASYSPPHSKWKDAFCCPDSPRSAPFRAHFQSLSSGQTGPHPLQSPLLTLKWTWGPPSRWAAQLGGSCAWAQQWGLYLHGSDRTMWPRPAQSLGPGQHPLALPRPTLHREPCPSWVDDDGEGSSEQNWDLFPVIGWQTSTLPSSLFCCRFIPPLWFLMAQLPCS